MNRGLMGSAILVSQTLIIEYDRKLYEVLQSFQSGAAMTVSDTDT